MDCIVSLAFISTLNAYSDKFLTWVVVIVIPAVHNVQVEGLGSWHMLLTLVLQKWRQDDQAVHGSRPGWTARLL